MTEEQEELVDELDNIYTGVFTDITPEYVKYINEVINIDTDEKIFLPQEILVEIQIIVKTIHALKAEGIGTDTYQVRVNKFNKFRDKAIEEYGILIPPSIPFSNPALLYLWIDALLMDEGLNDTQRNDFYKETNIRSRVPKKEEVLNELSRFDTGMDESLSMTEKVAFAHEVRYVARENRYEFNIISDKERKQEEKAIEKRTSLLYPKMKTPPKTTAQKLEEKNIPKIDASSLRDKWKKKS